MGKQNILYVSLFGSLQGGGQRSLLLLMKHLDKTRFCPFLLVPQEGELSVQAGRLDIPGIFMSFPKFRSADIFKAPGVIKSLRSCLKSKNINIIHVDSPRDFTYCALAARPLKIPVIYHSRVSDQHWWMDKIIYDLSTCIIAVSNSAAERFKDLGKADKVKVIYNGVELDDFKPITPEASGLRLGYLGRIDRRKNIETLIKAAGLFTDEIKVMIMGSGDEDYLKQLQAMSGSNVEFKPYNMDFIEELSLCHAVVLPSKYNEGLPRIIIEALAMGKIVIASDMPSNYEALGEDLSGFVFKAGDVGSLQGVISRLLGNPGSFIDFSAKARKRAEEFFDIRLNTRKIEEVYQEMLGL